MSNSNQSDNFPLSYNNYHSWRLSHVSSQPAASFWTAARATPGGSVTLSEDRTISRLPTLDERYCNWQYLSNWVYHHSISELPSIVAMASPRFRLAVPRWTGEQFSVAPLRSHVVHLSQIYPVTFFFTSTLTILITDVHRMYWLSLLTGFIVRGFSS